MAESFSTNHTMREVPAPCCGETVLVRVRIPTHSPNAFKIKNVVHCPSCGDVFKTTVFMMTETVKMKPSTPKLELVHG